MINTQEYTLFHKFIETYLPNGFNGINTNDPLIIEMEKIMEINNQYFFIGDVLQGKIIFTSKRSLDVIGVESTDLNPYHGIEACHPDEVYRNTKGWAKLICLANDLLAAKSENALLSVNIKLRNPKGTYSEILFQCYLFYSDIPHKTVYLLQIHTNIDKFKMKKQGYHYYTGNDFSYFRYPDEKLLQMGNIFTKRELEIIKLIESGLNSEQIAKKLFLSHYTINAHRSNILKKTNKSHISELIYELNERGLL
ncbi:MAG TPA: LuxR C-terminal-related transcriptional regulator [Flavobacterium sp.]|nr:LuxR C-terminal-related transcriptional regulator [Flavobacterium sp.]